MPSSPLPLPLSASSSFLCARTGIREEAKKNRIENPHFEERRRVARGRILAQGKDGRQITDPPTSDLRSQVPGGLGRREPSITAHPTRSNELVPPSGRNPSRFHLPHLKRDRITPVPTSSLASKPRLASVPVSLHYSRSHSTLSSPLVP